MHSYLLVFFAVLSSFQAHIVQSQNSSAVCTEGYKWAFNSGGESPCDVAGRLMEPCRGAGHTLDGLSPGASYRGPWMGPDTRCMCNTITWGLFSACGICQNGTAISWDVWVYNCSNATATSVPLKTSHQIDIPRWAYLDIGAGGKWNEVAARADKEDSPQRHDISNAALLAILLVPAGVVVALCVYLSCGCFVCDAGRGLPSILERIREKCTPQPGDVTTELATAPGEASSYA